MHFLFFECAASERDTNTFKIYKSCTAVGRSRLPCEVSIAKNRPPQPVWAPFAGFVAVQQLQHQPNIIAAQRALRRCQAVRAGCYVDGIADDRLLAVVPEQPRVESFHKQPVQIMFEIMKLRLPTSAKKCDHESIPVRPWPGSALTRFQPARARHCAQQRPDPTARPEPDSGPPGHPPARPSTHLLGSTYDSGIANIGRRSGRPSPWAGPPVAAKDDNSEQHR